MWQDPTTVGVEEEYHLVAADTGRLTPGSAGVLARLDGTTFGHELPLSQVETRTGVHQDLRELRLELEGLRKDAVGAAAAEGLQVIASGTAPIGSWREQPLTGGDRFHRIVQLHGQVAAQQMVCGCQVHVGIADRDTAVRLIDHLRPWLPVLLALSTSSPFWEDRDTGYASWRHPLWNTWGCCGPPPAMRDGEEYERVVDALLRSKTILDAKQLYWHLRPNRDAPTLEFRIADACTTIDETLLQVALARALVSTALLQLHAGAPAPEASHALSRAATWRASRSGMAGELLDPVSATPVPAHAAVSTLLEHVGPALDHWGDTTEVVRMVERIEATGTSADRQRRALAARGRLEDVVTLLVRETSSGEAG